MKQEILLTEEARIAIRNYLFKLVLPSGVFLGILASFVTFYINDIAKEKAQYEAYNRSHVQIMTYVEQTIQAKEKANSASEKVTSVLDDISKLKAKAEAAEKEIDSYLEKAKSSASLASSEKTLNQIASVLGESKDFLNKISLGAELPVGTIIPSMIPPHILLKPPYDNLWYPSDGRKITKVSKYYEMTGQINIPDLRGVFLRGLNEFDKGVQQSVEKGDPDGIGRIAGSYQGDQFATHNHGKTMMNWPDSGVGGNVRPNGGADQHPDHWNPRYVSGRNFGGKETRPRNVAIYWYIKIN